MENNLPDYQVVALNPTYLAEMVQIEQLCFALPWSAESYRYEMEENGLAHYLGCLCEGHLVGYGGFWQVLNEAHISNVAVHPAMRRRGVASAVMGGLIRLAAALMCERMTLEVRESNAAAIALYAGFGFVGQGVRPHYYEDNDEGALIMWLQIAAQ